LTQYVDLKPRVRSARVSKVIETKHKKHLLLIFHSKAKILIKKIIEQSQKKLALGKTFKKNKWKIL
jgi:hypothetical protein